MIKGFMMNLDTAVEFYERCQKANATTEQDRLAIMKQLLHERDIKIVKENQFKEVLKDKKVLVVKENKKHAS